MPAHHRQPSLLALRAFEAAARHLSFTEAAKELHVTQAAVSRHVRSLETTLGRTLFHRLYHRVELTAAGKELAGELTASFERMDRAVQRIRGGGRTKRLRLTVEPAFAAVFLVPRLGSFAAAHPRIELELDASEQLRSLGREADIAIRYISASTRKRPTAQGTHLFATDAIPVTKGVRSRSADLRADAAVLGRTLLHDGDGQEWRRWFEAAQLDGFNTARHQYFSDYSMALAAARRGQGVTIAMSVFVEQELLDGVLSQMGSTRVPAGDYWLFHARDRNTATVRGAFANWLKAELSRALDQNGVKAGEAFAR